MLQPVLDSLLSLLALVFGREPGTYAFYVALGLALFSLFLMGRLFVGLFKGSGGLIKTIFAMGLPLFIGGVAYAIVDVYVLPEIVAQTVRIYLPWVGFGVFLLLSVSVITKRIWDLSFLAVAFIYLFSVGAAAVVLSGTQALQDLMDRGSEPAEQREARFEETLEGISE